MPLQQALSTGGDEPGSVKGSTSSAAAQLPPPTSLDEPAMTNKGGSALGAAAREPPGAGQQVSKLLPLKSLYRAGV